MKFGYPFIISNLNTQKALKEKNYEIRLIDGIYTKKTFFPRFSTSSLNSL